MASFTIELPLPPKECGGNSRGHWAKNSGAIAAYRRLSCLECRKAMAEGRLRPLRTPVKVSMEFFLANPIVGKAYGPFPAVRKATVNDWYIPKDQENARRSMKSAVDGMVDAGVLPGDTQRYLVEGPIRLRTRQEEHQGRSCVVVTLEEAE